MELVRNRLLRDQLQSRGLDSDASEAEDIDGCDVDWAKSYASLVSCNNAITEKLSSADGASKSFQDMRDVSAKLPVSFQVQLSETEGEAQVELLRFFGVNAAFYLVRASLPLGLKLAKKESGSLHGAFVVEEVLPGGSAESCGQILPGDVLQALTAVAEGSDRSGWTDVMSNFVGGLEGGSLRRTLVDATFINTLDDLVEAIRRNKDLGPDVEMVLVFERNIAASPPPVQLLAPLATSESGQVGAGDWTQGLASPTRSTDIKR